MSTPFLKFSKKTFQININRLPKRVYGNKKSWPGKEKPDQPQEDDEEHHY